MVIYTGSFGSGKTELVINQSIVIKQKSKKDKVIIVDLDIVNPYFRSREKKEELERIGIKVIAPPGKFAMADLPLISPEIKGTLEASKRVLLLDVGGDDVGAKAISGFYQVLKGINYQLNMVINPYRPFTKNLNEMWHMLKSIEISSRLKVNGLISNPNLGSRTTTSVIIKGHYLVKEFSEQVNIPIRYLVLDGKFYKKIANTQLQEKLYPIKRYMLLPWDEQD